MVSDAPLASTNVDAAKAVSPNPAYTAPTIVVCGAGGCGINIARIVARNLKASTDADGVDQSVPVKFFDTSMANSRPGETVSIITGGHGSGGVRATNAAAIQKEVAALGENDLPKADVAILICSLSGGTGSVLGPILAREYAKRNARVVIAVVADSQAELFARNTENTMKTLTAIAENNNIYLPTMLYDNDTLPRTQVDALAGRDIAVLVDLLHSEATEVDKNDRLNFLNGTTTFSAPAGLKLLSVFENSYVSDRPQPLFSHDSTEQYDAILNIGAPELAINAPTYTRFRKDGIFTRHSDAIMGLISSNLAPLNTLLSRIDTILHVTKTQAKPVQISRLSNTGGDDLIL